MKFIIKKVIWNSNCYIYFSKGKQYMIPWPCTEASEASKIKVKITIYFDEKFQGDTRFAWKKWHFYLLVSWGWKSNLNRVSPWISALLQASWTLPVQRWIVIILFFLNNSVSVVMFVNSQTMEIISEVCYIYHLL